MARSHEQGIGQDHLRGSTGVWLGLERRTGQYLVFDKTMGGLRTARTILRMPEPQQWSLELVRGWSATPWTVHESSVPEVIHHSPGPEPAVENKLPQVRRVYVRQDDLNVHGYTKGCKRCQHILTYGPGTGTMPHSGACRERIMSELAKTEKGRLRLARMNERADKFIAEHMRQQIEATPAAAQGRKDEGMSASGPRQDDAPSADFLPFEPSQDLAQPPPPPPGTSLSGTPAEEHQPQLPSATPGMDEAPHSVPPGTAQDEGMDVDSVE